VAKHKHATVLLEQQLIAISKQAQHARHESFTTTARQTQFGSCDSVPQLYLSAPQLRSIVGRQKIDVIRYDIKEAYARALRMVARVITFHFRVSLSDRLFRFKPSLYKGVSMEAFAAANNQLSTSLSHTDTNSHYRMQFACTSMHLAEDPPASVFRVPIARVCSLVVGTAHYKRVLVL